MTYFNPTPTTDEVDAEADAYNARLVRSRQRDAIIDRSKALNEAARRGRIADRDGVIGKRLN